jgi:ferric-dicitrate binding protein FerR (iron transport regulator)
MNSWERRAAAERAVSNLVRMAQVASSDALSPSEQNGLLRLEAAIAEQRALPRVSARRPWGFRAGAALATAVAAAAVIAIFMRYRGSVQAFEVANGSVTSSGYIHPTAPEGARVRFGDGTEVVLESGARTRVAEVFTHGARVLLEEGKARLNVVPRREAKWLVEAGPYTIQVTGTVFDVAWLGAEESLDLWLREGSVVVTGPLTTQGFMVRAGQHLVARVRENLLLIDGQPSEDFRTRMSEAASEGPSPQAPGPARTGGSKVSRSTDAKAANGGASEEARALSWSKRLATGDFDGILADADRRGLDGLLSKASRADLAALADAARYARRFDVARRALLAERERFPGSVQANEAAFFLGGLAEADAASAPTALEWYERYLAESPQGTYASQVLGRKLMIVYRLRGREAARPLALGYLNQYPKGPYARYARNLLDTNPVK